MHLQNYWLKSKINILNTINTIFFFICYNFRYLIEIAKNYNIEYEPDPQVMKEELRPIGKYINNFLYIY